MYSMREPHLPHVLPACNHSAYQKVCFVSCKSDMGSAVLFTTVAVPFAVFGFGAEDMAVIHIAATKQALRRAKQAGLQP